MNLKTILGWTVVAFLVWWIIKEPTSAAHLVTNIGKLPLHFGGGSFPLRFFI